MTNIHTIFEVHAIKNPTKAEFFKNLRTGSKIRISIDIAKSYHVASFKVENLDSEETIYKSIGELAARLESFELIDISKA